MSELPWVRFYVSDWLAGTAALKAEERGVYITLIATMYETGRPVPEDHERLCRLCFTTRIRFGKALEVLVAARKIERVDGGLWNRRVEIEQEIRTKKQVLNKKAADTRWEKHKRNQWPPNALALRPQSIRNAIPETRKISNLTTSEQDSAPAVEDRSELLEASLRRMGRLKDGKDEEAAA